MGALTNLPELTERMSLEQRDDFLLPLAAIEAFMALSILLTVACSLGIFIVKLSQERDRIRREARVARARRLRYTGHRTEVHVDAVPDSHFHLFLSHVWGTGQDQMRVVKQRLKEMVPDLEVFLDVDDLEEIGDLEGYIKRSRIILVYCSNGCVRRLRSHRLRASLAVL